jgi:hypothetical protein
MPQTRRQTRREEEGDSATASGARGPSLEPRGGSARGSQAGRRGGNRQDRPQSILHTPEPPSELEILREQVRLLREEREIQALRDELAGEEPEFPVEIPGTTLPIRKRRRGESDVEAQREEQFLRSLERRETPAFKGESQKELSSFLVGWDNIFKGRRDVPQEFWRERILRAGVRLRGDAAVAWKALGEDIPVDWRSFETFLRGTLSDPAVRMAEALQTLYRLEQRSDQTVKELEYEIESLEQDIPEMTEEEKRAWILLLALKPTLRTSVLSEHKDITSRSQVMASAARHEQALALEHATNKGKGSRGESHAQRSELASKLKEKKFPYAPLSQASSVSKRTEESVSSRGSGERTSSVSQSDIAQFECYYCGGKGHTKVRCPSLLRQRSGPPQSRPPNIPSFGRTASASSPASGANATRPHDSSKKDQPVLAAL